MCVIFYCLLCIGHMHDLFPIYIPMFATCLIHTICYILFVTYYLLRTICLLFVHLPFVLYHLPVLFVQLPVLFVLYHLPAKSDLQ